MANKGKHHTGGRGGIRTHGTLAGTPVFKTGALNHSATLPQRVTSITWRREDQEKASWHSVNPGNQREGRGALFLALSGSLSLLDPPGASFGATVRGCALLALHEAGGT